MASKVIGGAVLPGVIIVHVVHLDTDSFSRSVNRAANKHWRSYGPVLCSGTNHVRGAYAHTDLGNRRCQSTLVYAESFERAEQVLKSLVK